MICSAVCLCATATMQPTIAACARPSVYAAGLQAASVEALVAAEPLRRRRLGAHGRPCTMHLRRATRRRRARRPPTGSVSTAATTT